MVFVGEFLHKNYFLEIHKAAVVVLTLDEEEKLVVHQF